MSSIAVSFCQARRSSGGQAKRHTYSIVYYKRSRGIWQETPPVFSHFSPSGGQTISKPEKE